MIEIPKQLRRSEFRFVKISTRQKVPFEKDWSRSKNYLWNNPSFQQHLKEGGNYGVVCGYGNLTAIDGDTSEVLKAVEDNLPATFTVKTGRGGSHFIFICKDLQKPIRMKEEKTGDIGDVQFTGKQVVGPGSIHPNGKRYQVIRDIPIAEVSAEQIRYTLRDFIKTDTEEALTEERDKMRNAGIDSDISILDVVDISGLKKRGSEYQGPHPVHGSRGGQNFCVNVERNLWHCFRCDSGGGPLSWIAVKEGLLKCSDTVAGALKGQKFKEVLQIASEKYGLAVKDYTIPSSKDNPWHKDNLLFYTGHLHLYPEIDRATTLYGHEYTIVKKALWYQLLSIPFRKVAIICGDFMTDGRIHVLYPLMSGSGKRSLIRVIETTSKALKLQYENPASFHPEALVGKTIRRGKKNPTFEDIPGPLSEDVVVLNEAIDIIRGQNDAAKEGRKYLNTALDPYPFSKIVKRMTDLPKANALSYICSCVLSIFAQPFYIDEEAVLVGTIRRLLIPYTEVKGEIDVENYAKKFMGVSAYPLNKVLGTIKKTLEATINAVGSNFKFTFTDVAVETLMALHLELIMQGYSHSKKGRNYTRIVDFTLGEFLIKMAAIQAGTDGRSVVVPLDVEKAYVDFCEFYACTLDYIQKKVYGNLDYGEGWGGARDRHAECLKWLYNKGATGKASSTVSVNDYINKIAEIFEISFEAARKKYQNVHKKRTWVVSAQTGQHETKVWLGFEPKNVQGVKWNINKTLTRPQYFTIIEKLKTGRKNQGGQGGKGGIRLLSKNTQKGDRKDTTGHPGHPQKKRDHADTQKPVQGGVSVSHPETTLNSKLRNLPLKDPIKGKELKKHLTDEEFKKALCIGLIHENPAGKFNRLVSQQRMDEDEYTDAGFGKEERP